MKLNHTILGPGFARTPGTAKPCPRPFLSISLFALLAMGFIRHDLHEIGMRHDAQQVSPFPQQTEAWSPGHVEPGPRLHHRGPHGAQPTRAPQIVLPAQSAGGAREAEAARVAEAARFEQARQLEWARQTTPSGRAAPTRQAVPSLPAVRATPSMQASPLATTRPAVPTVQEAHTAEQGQNTLTLEKVFALHIGMGVQDVVRIVNTGYVVTTRSGQSDSTQRYTWKNSDGSYLYVDFENGLMQGATYSGLK